MTLTDRLQQTLDSKSYAITRASEAAGDFAINLIIAVAIFVLTLWASTMAARLVRRGMGRFPQTRDDATLQSFASSVARYGVIIIGIVAVLHRLGVETTSIITVLGAASLAVGLALQGALSNVAAGVMILIFRPYRVGDYVTIAGKSGTVRKLDLFNTELLDVDGLKIVAPNAKGFSDVVVNYTDIPNRRMELHFQIRYEDDLQIALSVLKDCCAAEKRLLPEPAPWTNVTELGPSSITVTLRAWANLDEYWDTRFDLLKAVRLNLDARGLRHAYPAQLTVTAETSPPGAD
jgi:small conductance mechanosensitive channel